MARRVLEKCLIFVFNSTFQRAERRAYYANCLKAEQQPRRYLSLILDGMDQSKTNLPKLIGNNGITEKGKSTPSWRLSSFFCNILAFIKSVRKAKCFWLNGLSFILITQETEVIK